MTKRPKVDNAPGLTWRLLHGGWEGRWRARKDLINRGWALKNRVLFGPSFEYPTEAESAIIADTCRSLQDEMLVFAHGSTIQMPAVYDGTLASLIQSYRTEDLSEYRKLRHASRMAQDSRLKTIDVAHGGYPLTEIKARELLTWHGEWIRDKDGQEVHLSKGHDLMGTLRTLFNFGLTILEDADCQRLALVMSKLRFKQPPKRKEFMTAEQAVAVRQQAHAAGRPSIALCQAMQFDCMLRQKDLLGEWVPMSEPGMSDVTDRNMKWIRGARWEEIDQALVFTHVTSKRQKEVKIPLRMCPMVVEELALIAQASPLALSRDMLPAGGPMVIHEATGLPWGASTFRVNWRKLAKACGVPANVMSMHSRAGGITEATLAGAPIEHASAMATHSDVQTTLGYSRGEDLKVENVLKMRAEFRNRPGTK